MPRCCATLRSVGFMLCLRITIPHARLSHMGKGSGLFLPQGLHDPGVLDLPVRCDDPHFFPSLVAHHNRCPANDGIVDIELCGKCPDDFKIQCIDGESRIAFHFPLTLLLAR